LFRKGKWVSNMEKLVGGRHQPVCMLAHDLLNKLSVIIGVCDILTEHAESNPECAKRLAVINDTAKSMAKELASHECQLYDMVRTGREQQPVI
jgi:hypothetical protein